MTPKLIKFIGLCHAIIGHLLIEQSAQRPLEFEGISQNLDINSRSVHAPK